MNCCDGSDLHFRASNNIVPFHENDFMIDKNGDKVHTGYGLLESEKEYDYLFKILLIGSSGVGKSSLLIRYCDDIFSDSYSSTIGVDFRVKTIVLPKNNKKAKLQIWDTAGQERFRCITKAYYRGTNAIIIVFDLADDNWRTDINFWLNEIQNTISNVHDCIIFVGNKADTIEYKLFRETIENEISEYAKSLDYMFIPVSAKTGENVNELFNEICENSVPK